MVGLAAAAPSAAPSATPSASPSTPPASPPTLKVVPTPTGGPATVQQPSATPPAAKAEPYRFKFKDGDKDVEWDEDTARRNVQIGLRADKRMSDAARREKALAAREAALTGKDPEEILRAAGLDPDGWAFERTEKALQRQQMPEHEQKLLAAEQRAQAAEEKLTRREQAEKQAREQQETTAAERELEASYMGALEEFGFRPQSDPKHKDLELGLVVPLLAQEEHFLTQAGIPVNTKELVARVDARFDTLIGHRLGGLPVDKLYAKLEKIRPGAFNELAKHALALRAAPREPLTPAATPQAPQSATKLESEMTPAERLAEARGAFAKESPWRHR